MQDVPYGYCHCGCGQQTTRARQTHTERGWVKGEPLRFVAGHNFRGESPRWKDRQTGEGHDYIVDASGCWNWQRTLNENGYGVVQARVDGVKAHVYAHRWMYQRHVGPIPPDRVIDHLCRNRACCNPAHLELVTLRENTRRGKAVKLNRDDVLAIYRAEGTTLQIGERFGVHNSHVSRIKNGRVWADITEPERLPR